MKRGDSPHVIQEETSRTTHYGEIHYTQGSPRTEYRKSSWFLLKSCHPSTNENRTQTYVTGYNKKYVPLSVRQHCC